VQSLPRELAFSPLPPPQLPPRHSLPLSHPVALEATEGVPLVGVAYSPLVDLVTLLSLRRLVEGG